MKWFLKKERKVQNNTVLIAASFAFHFFSSLFDSVILFGRVLLGNKQKKLKDNRFLQTLDFVLYHAPKTFWKKPTAIKMGRSVATFIHYVFHKEQVFLEKEPRDNK